MTADEAVWTAVRRGDRKGTAVGVDLVYARTGMRLTVPELNAAVDRLLAGGHLYWRGQRVHRRLIAGPAPAPVAMVGSSDRQEELW